MRNAVCTAGTTWASSSDDRLLKPMVPGTSMSVPGTSITIDGRLRRRLKRLLATADHGGPDEAAELETEDLGADAAGDDGEQAGEHDPGRIAAARP